RFPTRRSSDLRRAAGPLRAPVPPPRRARVCVRPAPVRGGRRAGDRGGGVPGGVAAPGRRAGGRPPVAPGGGQERDLQPSPFRRPPGGPPVTAGGVPPSRLDGGPHPG